MNMSYRKSFMSANLSVPDEYGVGDGLLALDKLEPRLDCLLDIRLPILGPPLSASSSKSTAGASASNGMVGVGMDFVDFVLPRRVSSGVVLPADACRTNSIVFILAIPLLFKDALRRMPRGEPRLEFRRVFAGASLGLSVRPAIGSACKSASLSSVSCLNCCTAFLKVATKVTPRTPIMMALLVCPWGSTSVNGTPVTLPSNVTGSSSSATS
mmetsp:Transcript_17417/g.31399  ORF Transcript_17417/g.31399 Transcript_17417/m.31399 type:complete len:212 (-) Transcript_17417:295-930(-)